MRIHIENGPEPLNLRAARLAAVLAEAGITDVSVSENADPEAFETAVAGADILFACRKPDLPAARRAAPGLAWVQVISAGVETLVPTLPEGLILTNASGVHGRKGGEFILAAALMLNFRIPKFVTDKAGKVWSPVFGGPLAGKRVTLLGVGGVGAAAAVRLREAGAIVTGVTRSGRSEVPLDACVAVEALDDVLPTTAILASTLPLTPQTEGLLNARRLDLLPAGAGVINVGRALVMDHAALAAGLRDGRLGGAVLDVFPAEPLPQDDPLWDCPNLIMTPHCSVDDHETYIDDCLAIFVDNLCRFRNGQPLRNRVDPSQGY